jgi:tetratricopeptide (TPR) repeat protein
MKKNIFWISVSIAVFLLGYFIIGAAKPTAKEMAYADLMPRKNSLAYTNEWATMKNNVHALHAKIKKNPDDLKSMAALAAIYIQEGRITGNFDYYNKAALQCINDMLGKDPHSFEALTFKATILLSQHRFEEGLVIAKKVQQLYPLNAYVYGLLIDGNVELGSYDEALNAADKMVSIRPDIRSYSRIAYLREIYGDIGGAIEAMQLAIDAGARGDENTEWCRVQLGRLFEKIGKTKFAKMHYTIASQNRENYPYALAGLADIAKSEKNYSEALALYLRADSLIPDHHFKEGIVELYTLSGNKTKADSMSKDILSYMQQFSSAEKKEGQNEDHELAHAFMGVQDYEKALQFALAEYNRRPANIEVNETVAIVYYKKGEYVKALPFINTALRTNCKNPELLAHAGLIYAKNSMNDKAKSMVEKALANNPGLPADLEKELQVVKNTLKM